MDCGRWSGQRADPDGLDRVEERAALSSTAGDDSPVATSGTSTVSSSVMRTRNRSTWRVRRLTGWTWTAVTSTGLRLLAVDGQVDQRVRAGVAAELLELVRVDRDAGRIDAVAVDDGREAAGAAEAGDLLAGDVAMLGGQRRAGGGHRWEPLDRMRVGFWAAARRRGRKWRGAR